MVCDSHEEKRPSIQAGADPNAEDEEGSKAIQAAASAGHKDIVEHLLPLTTPIAGKDWTLESLLAENASVAPSSHSDAKV